jgi:hypothetical protein
MLHMREEERSIRARPAVCDNKIESLACDCRRKGLLVAANGGCSASFRKWTDLEEPINALLCSGKPLY